MSAPSIVGGSKAPADGIHRANASSNSKHEVKKSFFGKIKDLAARVVRAIVDFFKTIGAFFKRLFCGKTEAAQPSQPVSKATSPSSQEKKLEQSKKLDPLETALLRLDSFKQAASRITGLITQKGVQKHGMFTGSSQNIGEIIVKFESGDLLKLHSRVTRNFVAFNGLYHLWKVLEQEGDFVLTEGEAPQFIDRVTETALAHAAQRFKDGKCDNWDNGFNNVKEAYTQLSPSFWCSYREGDGEAYVKKMTLPFHGSQDGIMGLLLYRSLLSHDLPPYFVLIKKKGENVVGYLGFENGSAKGAIYVGTPQQIMDFIEKKNQEEGSNSLSLSVHNTWFTVYMPAEDLKFLEEQMRLVRNGSSKA